MRFTKEVVRAIKKFILINIDKNSDTITQITVDHFRISTPTVLKYINELIDDGLIEKKGSKRYPKYRLYTEETEFNYQNVDLEEDIIWAKDISKKLININQNVRDICQYGFTEMVNNVIDHSESKDLSIRLKQSYKEISMYVYDSGIGIFKKIQQDLGLLDPKHSILELAKGKFTSDPDNHTGEGIFFTSRIFDSFCIMSHLLTYIGMGNEDGWMFEDIEGDISGTVVAMRINKKNLTTIDTIFNEYADPDKTPGFHRTVIPVELMQHEGEALLSRSQAKRLITRFDKFLEVVLDFKGVKQIGQSFADQVFRVFQREHPNVHLEPINMNESIKNMVSRIQNV
jgi:anti-sigma regulatory factor (Ser/Thr protein kinase)